MGTNGKKKKDILCGFMLVKAGQIIMGSSQREAIAQQWESDG